MSAMPAAPMNTKAHLMESARMIFFQMIRRIKEKDKDKILLFTGHFITATLLFVNTRLCKSYYA